MRTAIVVATCLLSSPAVADDVLHPGTPALDPPTLIALGVALPITGDDNFTAVVAMRYREAGTTTWSTALPLQHVHAEAVQGLTVTPTFAGSIFDLRPDTSYEIELHATDADGAVDSTMTVMGRTRPVPVANPAAPRAVAVSSAAQLTTALAAAQPGDVITLAAGTYAGNFAIHASGTATNPIVIRGVSGSVLDGGNCTGCNVLEVYGSYTHVESLTLQNASRAFKWQTPGATNNVLRRVHIRDVTTAISSQANQTDFYVADNLLEGRLLWPCVYTSDDAACNGSPIVHGAHANDDGIQMIGNGHVVAHNTISGFGDAMKSEQSGAVSVDFYGNDVLWSYDNGIELDGTRRNARAWRNRLTNVFAALSFQPIFGGPSYAVRNVLYNVPDEPFKLHSNGGTPTVGAVIVHNTVVRSSRELQCSSSVSPLYFTVRNNVFLGPATLLDGQAVSWDLPGIPTASIDYNGYFPDGKFQYGYGAMGTTLDSLAAVVAAGKLDTHSVLVDASTLAAGAIGPADWRVKVAPIDPTLGGGSMAIDRAEMMPGINRGVPDLGALESGCDAPSYGVRAAGIDEATEDVGCGGGEVGADDPAGGSKGSGGGCCEAGAGPDGSWILGVLLVGGLVRRRRS
ncbi:hypothetical protein BH11MYX3_BH11MYX3_01780 [soil metagenome]